MKPGGRAVLGPVALVLVAAAVVLTVYAPTFASMVAVWTHSETFAHGMVILPVALLLLLRQRFALAASVPAVTWSALAAVAACVALWLVGALVEANVVSHFAMMAMVPAFLLLVLGRASLATIGFPVAFSLLAVPAGQFLIAPMMDLTANGSVMLLHLSGVPVFQDQWLISIPAGNFQVADACSGVRYLIGAATTGVLFAYLFFRSWKKRIFFMIFVVILTIVANVLRAYIIILLAHLTDMRLAVGVDHFIYGWFLFSLLLLMVFAVGLRFADGRAPAAEPGPPRFLDTLRSAPGRYAVAGLVGALALAAGPLALARLNRPAGEAGFALPVHLGSAQFDTRIPAPAWLSAATGWRAHHVSYRGTVPFEVHVFRGAAGAGGRNLTTLREALANGQVTLVSDEPATIATAEGPLETREMRLQQGRNTLMVGYWFAVGEGRTANPVTAKIMEFGTMMQGEHKKPALIAIALEIKGLDQPGASLHAIVADVANWVSTCGEQSGRQRAGCESLAPGQE